MSFESPISVLQNLAGEEVAIVSGSALNNGEQPGVAVLAKDESGNAQFLNLNAAGELKVQASVDVDLDYSTDSIKVYGSQDAALVQDASDNYLLVRDQDAADAIDAASTAISGAVAAMDSNLGGKLDGIDTSVDAVGTAVDNASTAISGAVAAMDLNLGGKLDTLDGSVDAAKDAIDAAAVAITGSIASFENSFNSRDLASETTLDAFKTAFEAEDFASETTLAAFKSANHEDLMSLTGSVAAMDSNLGGKLDTLDTSIGAVETAVDSASAAISGSIAALGADFNNRLNQFTLTDGALLVTGNLNVDVSLTQADEVTVYQGTDPWVVSATAFDIRPLTSADVVTVDNMVDVSALATEVTLDAFKSANHLDIMAVSGAIEAFRTNFNEFVPGLSGAIAEGNASLVALEGKDFATETTLGLFKTAFESVDFASNTNLVSVDTNLATFAATNHGDLLAISGALEAARADLNAQLDQLTFNASGSLKVEADVNVTLNYVDDSVTSHQGGTWDVSVNNFPAVQAVSQDGAPWSVTATDLDIRDLDSATDSVTVYQGTDPWVVSATALDIRALTSADVVTVDGFSTFASANHTDIEAVGTAVGSASTAISGSVVALGADLGAKLNTIDGSIGDVETAVSSASTAISGAVAAAETAIVNAINGTLDIRVLDHSTDSVTSRANGTSATVSEAGASTSSAEVLSANANRMSAMFFMDGNATCYIKLGSSASNSSFSVRLINNGYYELPEGYQGAVHAAFSVTDGGIKLRITELAYV